MSGESQRLQRLLEQPLKAGLARTTTAREGGGYCSNDRAANISKTVLQDILSFSLLLTFGLTFYRQPLQRLNTCGMFSQVKVLASKKDVAPAADSPEQWETIQEQDAIQSLLTGSLVAQSEPFWVMLYYQQLLAFVASFLWCRPTYSRRSSGDLHISQKSSRFAKQKNVKHCQARCVGLRSQPFETATCGLLRSRLHCTSGTSIQQHPCFGML